MTASVHRHMVDLALPPLAWPVLAEIALTADYSTGVSVVTPAIPPREPREGEPGTR